MNNSWTTLEQLLNNSWTTLEQFLKNSWTTLELFLNNSWQLWNRSWPSREQLLNNFYGHLWNNSSTTYEHLLFQILQVTITTKNHTYVKNGLKVHDDKRCLSSTSVLIVWYGMQKQDTSKSWWIFFPTVVTGHFSVALLYKF